MNAILDALWLAYYLQVPVVIGGVLHMVVVSRNLWPALARPVHAGLFGANKTWRGFVVMPLATALGALCLWPLESALAEGAPFGVAWLLPAGLVAGLGYVLAELPNSWMKRRLGIAPGATPARHRRVFIALDQFDSGAGVALAWWLWPGLPALACVLYAATFPLTALAVKQLLYRFRLKKSAT